jgi:TolB protein
MPLTHSTLEIFDLQRRQRRVLMAVDRHIEAPNWSRDGQFLVVNGDGLLYRVPLDQPTLTQIDTGFATRCNNDHGISPDGQSLVVSHHDAASGGGSILCTLPITGGAPQRVTTLAPSYWHGWSPDGRMLAFVAGRAAHTDYKIYRLDLQTGQEQQLSFGPGLDDGPDYSPCGRFIYFNAFRDGRMQIWRMDADGQHPQQVVHSAHSDWFPHPSPDGQHLVFIRYVEDQGQAHPFGRDVQLMLFNMGTGTVDTLTEVFYGGQGTLNVPSWAPDGSAFAFVSYRSPPSLP